MFIVIAGNFDYKCASKVIHKVLDQKTNRLEEIKVKEYKEPKTVAIKEQEISTNIKVPKIGLGYKFVTKDFRVDDEFELSLYLTMISTLLFGRATTFREKLRNKHLMTNFYFEWESIKDYKTLIIYSETENPDLLIDEVQKELENIQIEEDDFERMKKVWIANEVKMIDYVDTTVSNIYYDLINYHRVVDNKVDLIRKMNKKRLDQILSNMNFKNRSKVILLPNKIITKESD